MYSFHQYYVCLKKDKELAHNDKEGNWLKYNCLKAEGMNL
jgi:hypothetical protein